MTENELFCLNNVLCDKWGFELICILLKKFGAFERGLNCNLSEKEIFMQLGKRATGIWLSDCILETNQDKFLEIVRKIRKDIK